MLKKLLFVFIIFLTQIPLNAFNLNDLFNNRFIKIGQNSKSVINIDTLEDSTITVGNGKVSIGGQHVLVNKGSIIQINGGFGTYSYANFISGSGPIIVNGKLFLLKSGDRIEISNGSILINGQPAEIKQLSGTLIQKPLETSINKVSIPSPVATVRIGDKSYIECDSSVNDKINFSVENGKLSAQINDRLIYQLNDKQKSLCTVYAKIINDAIKANNYSHVSIENQSITNIDASDYARIDGTSTANNLNISTDLYGKVHMTGSPQTYDSIKLSTNTYGEIIAEGINVKKLNSKVSLYGEIKLSGNAQEQEIEINQYGSYNASRLKSQIAHIYASHYANAKLNAKNISGKAKHFSKVRYAQGADVNVKCDQFSSCKPYYDSPF